MATSDELAAQLQQLLDNVAAAKEALEPFNLQSQELTNRKRIMQDAYKEQMAQIDAEQKALEANMWPLNATINNASWEAQQLKNKIEKAQQEEAAKQKELQEAADRAALNAAFTERMDQLTLTAPWREWAKNHQIEGGHKIVMDKNVILADPMGLGKTLTSIITVEMAERVTKDATPENPYLGEEEEVYVPAVYKHKETGQETRFRPSSDKMDEYDYIPAKYEKQIVGGITRAVGRRVLYLCPNSLLRNVMDEWRNWAPNRNVTYIGGMTKNEQNFLFENILPNLADYVIICNFEAWRKNMALIDTFIACDFDTLIIDEAHNAKDRNTIVWRGINKLLEEKRPEYVIPMTGTPILNKPQELFTLLNFVNPRDFFKENDFLYTYCEQYETPSGAMAWKFQEGGLDRIAKKISKNFMRRTRDQAGIELPPVTTIHHDIDVELEEYPNQARVRDQMRTYMTIIIDEAMGKALSAQAVIAMYTRLRQIETWPAGIVQRDPVTKEIINEVTVEESQKIDYIISGDGQDGLIPEIVSDERVVLFSQFKAPLHELKRRIEVAGYKAVVFDGSTPKALQDEIRKDFDAKYTKNRSESKWDVVLCNYKVGGVGLNFTAASQMIIVDEEWNPGKRDQAYGRVDRIGQEHPVTIHVVRMKKTIDDWLAQIMETKEALVEGFESAVTLNAQSLKDAIESGLV